MSQYADTIAVLPTMLQKYPQEHHQAIVETFCESIGPWPDEDLLSFLKYGKGYSEEADHEIEQQLYYNDLLDKFNILYGGRGEDD